MPALATSTSSPRRANLGFVVVAILVCACSATSGSPTPETASTRPTISANGSSEEPSPAPSGTGPAAAFPDWPTFGGDAVRSGAVDRFPATGRPGIAWGADLDGAVYAQPIVAGGRLYVATEGDSVYALDPANGRVLWRARLGTPLPLSRLPCGNIDPLGITGTPVYDAATGSLFVVAEVEGPAHLLFALDPSSGAVRWSRSVDWPSHDPTTHQQRPALAVGNGRVYVGFGGLAGDCGQYNGVVVGVPTSGDGPSIAYTVPTAREGAIWATGGPVIDPAGHVYVSVGNGSSTSAYDGSDSVIELSPTLSKVDLFAPSTWAADNAGDADLGSLSPSLLPGGWVFIAGKSGTGYVLRQGALGGIGGEVSSRDVCRAFGAAAHVGATAYVPCTDGIRAITVDSAGEITLGWHTDSGASGPPAIGGGAAWSVNVATGVLYALDQASGAVLASIEVGAVPHFAAPSLSGGLVFVGTMSGVVAVRASV